MTSRGVVAAGAGEDRHAAGRLVGQDLDDAHALGVGQRRALARRAAGHEEVDAGVDLPSAEPRTRFSSRSPVFVNGVTSAVPTPVNMELIEASQV